MLKTLRWYLENELIPYLPCEATIQDYINDKTNFEKLCLYRFVYNSTEYVRVIYKDDHLGKITFDEYNFNDESNLLFGNCLFQSKKEFYEVYYKAKSRLADEQYFSQIHLTKLANGCQ